LVGPGRETALTKLRLKLARRGTPSQDQERPRDSIDDTLDWLAARKENCLPLAMQKTGKDRDGWIEDGAFFGCAISLIRRAYR
jgi:hypothetical protein